MDVAVLLVRAHRRTNLLFWTADDGFQTTHVTDGRLLDDGRVEIRLRRLGFGTLRG